MRNYLEINRANPIIFRSSIKFQQIDPIQAKALCEYFQVSASLFI
jgi:hypothetical protein